MRTCFCIDVDTAETTHCGKPAFETTMWDLCDECFVALRKRYPMLTRKGAR